MIVYLARNKINGMCYVGQTSRPILVRVKEHLRHCRRQDRRKGVFHKALLKHGQEAFEWEILGRASGREQLDELERAWVAALNCVTPNGYNLETGGNRNKNHSPRSRKLIAEAARGVVFSEERKAKISETKRGQKYAPRTEEHKRKLSECKMGSKNPSAVLSDQQVEEIRLLASSKSKPQSQIALQYGVSQSTVSAIHLRKRRQ